MRSIRERFHDTPAHLKAALPVAVLIAVITYGAYWWIEVRPPDTYAPLRTVGLFVTTPEVAAGGQGFVLNGFCLDGDHPIAIEVHIGMQRIVEDQLIEGQAFDLQTEVLPIDPGCVATDEPLAFDVPLFAPPGEYRLFMDLTVPNPNGPPQNLTETSNTFVVTPGEE